MTTPERLLLLLLAVCGAWGCGPSGSTLTHPPRKGSFPMYVTIPGTTAGTGALCRIDAPEGVDAPAPMVVVATGLAFPAGLAVDRAGAVYFTERPTPTTGRIMKLAGEGLPPELVVDGLADPQGLAIDRVNRLYVVETGASRISLVNSDGSLEEIRSGLAGPRSIVPDENDNLYVAELDAGTVSKIIPGGGKQELATGLRNPVGVGPGLVGSVFYLVGNSGLGDGSAVKLDGGGGETYLEQLINPRALDWEDARILFVAEGAPAQRIIKYSRVSGLRTEVAGLPGDPHSIAFTPVN